METSRFDGMLPACCVAVDAQPWMWLDGLTAEEQAAVRLCVPKRRREFTAGRNCVRHGLARLGRPAASILVGPTREPVFPAGVTGSITHTDDFCAAAMLGTEHGLCIGIDAERAGPLEDGVAKLLLTPCERRQAGELRGIDPGGSWERVIFSAKESVQKALFGRSRTILDFLTVQIDIDPRAASFRVRLLDPSPRDAGCDALFEGRYRAGDELVMTTATVPSGC